MGAELIGWVLDVLGWAATSGMSYRGLYDALRHADPDKVGRSAAWRQLGWDPPVALATIRAELVARPPADLTEICRRAHEIGRPQPAGRITLVDGPDTVEAW